MPRSLYHFWLRIPPSWRRSGNETFAAFLVELLRGSKIERERWIATILGKTVMRM
jgi:hypothetical protein